MAEKKSKQVLAAEKRRQEKQEAENTLRRETRDVTTKKITPPSELGVVNNLTNAAKDGVKKAKEVGSKVVTEVKNIGSTARQALKTLQNPTAAEKALEERKAKREGKAYGGKVKKMAYGGKVMKMADGKMVKKKKKTTKVVRRRGDGCAVRGKTKGRMV